MIKNKRDYFYAQKTPTGYRPVCGLLSLSLANPPCAPVTVKISIFPLGVTAVVQGTAGRTIQLAA